MEPTSHNTKHGGQSEAEPSRIQEDLIDRLLRIGARVAGESEKVLIGVTRPDSPSPKAEPRPVSQWKHLLNKTVRPGTGKVGKIYTDQRESARLGVTRHERKLT